MQGAVTEHRSLPILMKRYLVRFTLTVVSKRPRKFIQGTILDDSDIILNIVQKNYKSLLLELTQARKFGHPSYHTITEDGPDHDKVFTVEVSVQGVPCGIGKGKTKKSAQQLAAKECLMSLNEDEDDPV